MSFYILIHPSPHSWLRKIVICCRWLFNDGDVLQLRDRRDASPSVDGWYMVWMTYEDHMITGDECDPNVLTFVLRLRENSGKTWTRKLTRPAIEPAPAASEVTMLPLDHSGGKIVGLAHQRYIIMPVGGQRVAHHVLLHRTLSLGEHLLPWYHTIKFLLQIFRGCDYNVLIKKQVSHPAIILTNTFRKSFTTNLFW